MAALDSKGSGGREAANCEQLLLSVLQPTEADLEAMRKFSVLRTKLYKKEAQEQRKARKGKEKEDKEKDKEKEESKRYESAGVCVCVCRACCSLGAFYIF
jgi:hypothetical protein